MGNNKSPGKAIRRITKKLYEVAWIKTKESLLKLVQYAKNNQQSSVSQGQAITKLFDEKIKIQDILNSGDLYF